MKKIRYYYKRIIFSLKNFLPQSFLTRSLLIIGITLLVIQIITIIIFYDSHWRKIKYFVINGIVRDIVYTVYNIENVDNIDQMRPMFKKSNAYLNIMPQLSIQETPPVQAPIKAKVFQDFKRKINSFIPNNIVLEEYNSDYSIIKLTIHIRDNIYLTAYLEKNLFFITSFDYLIALVIVFYFIILLIILQFFRLQLRPLKRLISAYKKFGRGEKIEYLVPSGSLEIRQAITSFNTMKDQVETFIEQRTMLLSSVSHDLKTSLTKINLLLELSPSDLSNEIKEETEIMKNIISSYLNFAKGEFYSNEKQVIIIKDFFNKIIKSYKNVIKISIEYKQTTKKISINLQSFLRAITNIIDNAQKYSDTIKITISDNGNHSIFIIMEDNGIGIPEGSYEEVFKPFFKMNQARTAEKSSVGLGLYIVKDIITKHGGNISLNKSSLGGLCVKISMPL